jgi:hypothetical protein
VVSAALRIVADNQGWPVGQRVGGHPDRADDDHQSPIWGKTSRRLPDYDERAATLVKWRALAFLETRYVEYGFLKVPFFEDPKVLVEQGFYTFVDAAGAIAYFGEAADAGVREIHLFGVLPGEAVESGTRRLEYVAEHVVPAFSTADVVAAVSG